MKDNLFWHEVNEKEKEEIKTEAKKLLDEFSAKLSSIKGIEEHFKSSISEDGTREQEEPWKYDPNFRDLMLLNAPFVENDFLVAEKGGWKK